MVTLAEAQRFSMAFENVTELPHFEVTSFRVKKKIFATLNKKENRACLKLSLIDQDVFCSANKDIFYAVPNAWGKYGWTLVNLPKVRKTIFKDALTCAYNNVITGKKSVMK